MVAGAEGHSDASLGRKVICQNRYGPCHTRRSVWASVHMLWASLQLRSYFRYSPLALEYWEPHYLSQRKITSLPVQLFSP